MGANVSDFLTCAGAGAPHALEWYLRNNITVTQRRTAVAVDLEARRVMLNTGSSLVCGAARPSPLRAGPSPSPQRYDQLIVATGAAALRPPALQEGVLYLRSLDDARHLREAAEERCTSGAVVVGGGYIGVEVAAALAENGRPVLLLCPEQSLLSRAVPACASAVYRGVLEAAGVEVRFGARAASSRLCQGGAATELLLEGGETLQSELVVAGLGARPRSELVAGQVETAPDGAILVDARCQTSVPGVYAVGDVAAPPGQLALGSGDARWQHVEFARATAAHAVRAIVQGEGEAPDFRFTPTCYSRFLGVAWRARGATQGEPSLRFGEFRSGGPGFGAAWLDASGRTIGTFLDVRAPEADKMLADLLRRRAPEDELVAALATLGLAPC